MNRLLQPTAAMLLALLTGYSVAWAGADDTALVAKVLADMPVIDGHNDLPWEIRDRFGSSFESIDLEQNMALLPGSANAPARNHPPAASSAEKRLPDNTPGHRRPGSPFVAARPAPNL